MLIHGIGHRRQAWSPVFRRLAEHFDVIAADLPGFGESPPLRGVPTTMANVLRALEENFEAWGMSGRTSSATRSAARSRCTLGDQGLARSVIALSPGGFFRVSGALRAMFVLLALKLGSHAPERLLRRLAYSELGRWLSGVPLYAAPDRYSPKAALADAFAMRRGQAFWPTYRPILLFRYRGGVPVPTTIVWGTLDRLLSPRQAERARVALPDAVHLTIDGAGHVPMGDRPEDVVTIIRLTAARAG